MDFWNTNSKQNLSYYVHLKLLEKLPFSTSNLHKETVHLPKFYCVFLYDDILRFCVLEFHNISTKCGGLKRL
jgi:hypothetical protein